MSLDKISNQSTIFMENAINVESNMATYNADSL
jgi:hypothetical protein